MTNADLYIILKRYVGQRLMVIEREDASIALVSVAEGMVVMSADAPVNETGSYAQALVVFRDLCEDSVAEGFANEYVRGGVNLIADLFGIVGMDTGARMDDVLADLRRIPMFADCRDLAAHGVTPYVHDPAQS